MLPRPMASIAASFGLLAACPPANGWLNEMAKGRRDVLQAPRKWRSTVRSSTLPGPALSPRSA